MEVRFDISTERIQDLLISAFEGGSNYWIDKVEYAYDGRGISGDKSSIEQIKGNIGGRPMFNIDAPLYSWLPFLPEGAVIICYGSEEGEAKRAGLTKAKLEFGLELMAKKYPNHFSDLITDNADADTADVYLQCCLLGEIVYG